MIKNLHKTVIIKTSNSRKSSASSIGSDSTSTKSDIKLKLPISTRKPLQPLKEVSEPNTPDIIVIPQTSQIATRKSRFQKHILQTEQFSSCSSSDCSEHNVWNDDEILLKGVHLGDFEKLSPTDELQMLFKVRFETHPNLKEQISESQLALETQKLMNKIKFHYLRYKKILPLEPLSDYTKPYDINKDKNYMRFWDYYRDRNNHRKHKRLILADKCLKENLSSEHFNPIVRNTSRIKTEYRIKSLAQRRF